jgi:hypothetical protein
MYLSPVLTLLLKEKTMKTVLEVHNNLFAEASEKNHADTRVLDKIEIGQAFRQGDVYVTRIAEVPKNAVGTVNMQIAKGQTKGSRHILVETKGLRVYNLKDAGPLDGPVFSSTEEICLTHPEHAHFRFPAGTYSTHYQTDFAADELRAVRD